ncbi:hypothetical protein PI124_g19751 [Phytophthora idaei]|nr:hypothetical protein PI125_g23460 [Phytophthora idaei]KAG3128441.1 hypothetical protein PI126_g21393 [Phytophthora idaei]KAG3235209.1 hypothetical protein PI124_g19751 [Phytophthora idaei]
MLIWDDFSAHWTAKVIQYAAQKNVILQRVPPGYTRCCQPADISWNKPLKDRLRAGLGVAFEARVLETIV